MRNRDSTDLAGSAALFTRMHRSTFLAEPAVAPSRHTVLTRRGLLSGAAAFSLASCLRSGSGVAAPAGPVELEAGNRTIEVNGRAASVFGIRQRDGTHGAIFNTGDRFRVRLANRLGEPTLVHWHGLTPPYQQDGVPELSQHALDPGQSADYDFLLVRPGTNWMHSHVGLQEQMLHSAPLIVRDPSEAHRDEHEVVMLLNDFSFQAPSEIIAGLARAGMQDMAMSSYGTTTMQMRSVPPAGESAGPAGMAKHMHMDTPSAPGTASAQTHAGTSMDLNDVDYDAFLANDRTLSDPDVVRVERGGRVRLRIINAAAATGFFIDLGKLEGKVIAVDGMPVEPYPGQWLELATAQRLDIRVVLPPGEGAYPILAQREGDVARTGVILATAGANVTRVPGTATQRAGAVGLDLERRLRAEKPLAQREPDRRIVVNLTGSMSPYLWTLNGQRFGESDPLLVRHGERVEIEMRNQTGMSHPMHLHGHHFQVSSIAGERLSGALRDTVLVPANSSVAIVFEADNPGRWAFHCHNLYHMFAGMMTEIRYDS